MGISGVESTDILKYLAFLISFIIVDFTYSASIKIISSQIVLDKKLI